MLEADVDFFRIAILFLRLYAKYSKQFLYNNKKKPTFSLSTNSLCLEDDYFTARNFGKNFRGMSSKNSIFVEN